MNLNLKPNRCRFVISPNDTCAKGFFGGESVEIRSNSAHISERECREVLSKNREGQYVSSEHPKPVCSWMKTSTTTKNFISTNQHSVRYDPYADVLHSSLFLGGRCKDKVCRTIFENRIWLQSGTWVAVKDVPKIDWIGEYRYYLKDCAGPLVQCGSRSLFYFWLSSTD